MNGGDIIKVTKSAMLLEKSYPPGDHILRVSCFNFFTFVVIHIVVRHLLVLHFVTRHRMCKRVLLHVTFAS